MIVGVLHAPGGWLVAKANWTNLKITQLSLDLWGHVDGVIQNAIPDETVIVAHPLSLPDDKDQSPRPCDKWAKRQLLTRSNSIIKAPLRNWLRATDYDQVKSKGVNKELYGLFPFYKQLDDLSQEAKTNWHESHPELIFNQLDPQAILKGKKKPAGIAQRLDLLSQSGYFYPEELEPFLEKAEEHYGKMLAGPESILECLSLLIPAAHIRNNTAKYHPKSAPSDSQNRPFQMVL
ncbi:DUF429 domain-containing protein [bacterium]|jgi:predicted RNase H-like nuclease|nr:DUF429 domain-containing protein [bacterium]